MKKLNYYADQLNKAKQSPGLLADLLSDMSIDYAYLSEQHLRYKLVKADWLADAKYYTLVDGVKTKLEKPLSDLGVESKWRTTEKGKEEYELKFMTAKLEKLMSNLRSILSQKKQELSTLNYE